MSATLSAATELSSDLFTVFSKVVGPFVDIADGLSTLLGLIN